MGRAAKIVHHRCCQIKQIEKAREARLEKAPREGAHPMVLMLASIKGVGLEDRKSVV